MIQEISTRRFPPSKRKIKEEFYSDKLRYFSFVAFLMVYNFLELSLCSNFTIELLLDSNFKKNCFMLFAIFGGSYFVCNTHMKEKN